MCVSHPTDFISGEDARRQTQLFSLIPSLFPTTPAHARDANSASTCSGYASDLNRMVTHFLSVFLLSFIIIQSAVANTEIVILHSSTPVPELPSESVTVDYHFSNTFPSSSEKIFNVNRNHIAYFDCQNCTEDPTDIWFTLSVFESGIVPLATTVRLSWSTSDAMEFDIAVFKQLHDQDDSRRFVRIRPFRTDITGNSVSLGVVDFAPASGTAFSDFGDSNVRFHIKVEALLWRVVPMSMLGPGVAIFCLLIFGYTVLSPLVISFLRQFSTAVASDLKEKKTE